MQVTLAQAGIVAGILTLSWVVGRPKDIYSAPPSAKGRYSHQVFNTPSKAHAEKVASLVPDSFVQDDSGHYVVMSKTPYYEATLHFLPWLRENDYFRTNQFLSEVKYEAESVVTDHENCGMGPSYCIECGEDACFDCDTYCDNCEQTIHKNCIEQHGDDCLEAESFSADWWVHYDKEIDLPCEEKLLRAYEYIVTSNPKGGQEKLSQFLESLGHYQGEAESFDAEGKKGFIPGIGKVKFIEVPTPEPKYDEEGRKIQVCSSCVRKKGYRIRPRRRKTKESVREDIEKGYYDEGDWEEVKYWCPGTTVRFPRDGEGEKTTPHAWEDWDTSAEYEAKQLREWGAEEPKCGCLPEAGEGWDSCKQDIWYPELPGHRAESHKLNPVEKPIISGAASGATIEGLEDLMMSEPYDSEDCPLCLGKIDFIEAYEESPRDLCDGCYDAVQEKRYDHAYSAETLEDMRAEYTGHYSGGAYEECWDKLFFEMAGADKYDMVDRMEEIENEVLGKYEDKESEGSQEELAELRTKLSKQRTGMSAMRTALAAMGLYLAYDTYKDHKKSNGITKS